MRYDLTMIELVSKTILRYQPTNFIEIGSRDGHDTEHIRRVFNLAPYDCWIFEAHPDCYNQIKAAYPEVNLYNCAVTNITKPIVFNAGVVGEESNIGGSSILEDASGKFVSNKVEVDGWRFDELCSQLGLKQVDLAKVDVEGHTLEVLEGFGKMLSTTKILQLELEHEEAWVGQKLYTDVAKYLQEHSFEQVFFIKTSYDQSDSLWVNKNHFKI